MTHGLGSNDEVTKVDQDVFSLNETHALLHLPGCRKSSSSENLGWTSMFVSNQHEAPFDVVMNPCRDHLVVLPVGRVFRVHGSIQGKSLSKLARPGDICVWPAESEFAVRIEETIETLHVYIRDRIVADVASSYDNASRPYTLKPVFGRSDELLEQLVVEAWRTARLGLSQSAIYADQLALSIASRLIWLQSLDNGERAPAAPQVGSGLSFLQMRMVEDYVEARLDNAITLDDLCGVANLSRSYFVRQFKRSARISPHQFVLRRRIDRSKRLLRHSRKSIAQIAFECGFAHQEHLTQTFKRQTGTTPAEYRKVKAI